MKDYIDVLIDDLETRIFQLTPEYSRNERGQLGLS